MVHKVEGFPKIKGGQFVQSNQWRLQHITNDGTLNIRAYVVDEPGVKQNLP